MEEEYRFFQEACAASYGRAKELGIVMPKAGAATAETMVEFARQLKTRMDDIRKSRKR
jgi:hypothetical protein